MGRRKWVGRKRQVEGGMGRRKWVGRKRDGEDGGVVELRCQVQDEWDWR